MSEKLQADIAQLKELLISAKRTRIQNMLSQLLSQLKTELELLKTTQPKELPDMKQEIKPANYQPLTKYSWEQENNKVKIYFTLANVGNQVKADQVNIKYEKQAVTIKLHSYQKQNWIFAIPKLGGQIEMENCRYLLKTNSLCIILIKKDGKNWSDLKFKEEKFKSEKPEEKSQDPNASLMNMMKKMYDEGDDNMKKTIAEAWTKAQDKKSPGGLE